jgi:hypothetical protein
VFHHVLKHRPDSHVSVRFFRSPSFQLINNYLRIFQESVATQSDSTRAEIDDAYEFFKEVLLSYRLIFSQTKSSRKTFKKQWKKWDLTSRGNIDPILERLCGHSCDSEEARDLYYAIDADDPSSHYNPISDFPFLGKRLTDIQDYVSGHNPHSFKALWYDRRNVTWWWTFWVCRALSFFAVLDTEVIQGCNNYRGYGPVFSVGPGKKMKIPTELNLLILNCRRFSKFCRRSNHSHSIAEMQGISKGSSINYRLACRRTSILLGSFWKYRYAPHGACIFEARGRHSGRAVP